MYFTFIWVINFRTFVNAQSDLLSSITNANLADIERRRK